MSAQTATLAPRYCEVGSHGPAINLFLVGLVVVGNLSGLDTSSIILDGVYGEKGAALAREYQTLKGLDPDAGLGPATRVAMKGDGYDIDYLLSKVANTGVWNVFIQPDGSCLGWMPGSRPIPVRAETEEPLVLVAI